MMAQSVDDAKSLYEQGRYTAALSHLQAIVKKTPRDGSANYWLGMTLVALNRNEEAIGAFERAEARGVADAALQLARIDRNAYNPSEAREHYESYQGLIAKSKKKIPADVETEISNTILLENMLERVEKIAVIDSIVVDAEQFFKAYHLSPECGRLVEGDIVHLPDTDMAFVTQNNSQIIFSAPDSLGNFTLMGADILDDGSTDRPRPLRGADLSGGGNAEYPFMLSDGLTLYYANDGAESIGGYDIFMTRRDAEGRFLQPQNIGMPFNSPYDDYLLAIDEATGLGWWATDRNRIPGKVTIYVFVPSETRVNVSPDDPNLIALAQLSDISLTREPSKTYPSVPTGPIAPTGDSDEGSSTQAAFQLPIAGTGRVYTSLSDFRKTEARKLMAQAINAKAEIKSIESKLTSLRAVYATGNHSCATDILNLERDLDAARQRMRSLTNKAIQLESNN